VHAAVDAGIRMFDTADAYGSGTSELVLGEALAGRDDVVVATKVGYRFDERRPGLAADVVGAVARRLGRGVRPYSEQDFSVAGVERAVVASLRRLRRDHLDLLQFHGPPIASSSDLPEAVRRLIDAGTVRWFGVGCERLDVADSWVGVHGLAAIQLPFGVLDPQAATGAIAVAHQRNVGVIARGVLGGGILARAERGEPTGLDAVRAAHVERLQRRAAASGVDLLQLAMWFGRHRAEPDVVLIGMSTEEQVIDTIRRFDAALPAGPLLDEIRAIVEDGA
jgi:aryl-alcohol dehydrogenase-like predicted oxidoreductase